MYAFLKILRSHWTVIAVAAGCLITFGSMSNTLADHSASLQRIHDLFPAKIAAEATQNSADIRDIRDKTMDYLVKISSDQSQIKQSVSDMKIDTNQRLTRIENRLDTMTNSASH